MEGTELVAFQIIASVGSPVLATLRPFRRPKGNFAGAEELMVKEIRILQQVTTPMQTSLQRKPIKKPLT